MALRICADPNYGCDVSARYIGGSGLMLELAILGLLQEAPMHGYELRKELATKLGTLRAAMGGATVTLRPRASCGRGRGGGR